MQFAEPIWLLVGPVFLAAFIGLWFYHDVRQKKALAKFAASHLHVDLTASLSVVRRLWRRGLLLMAVVLGFIALARPQIGYHWEEVKRNGVEIMFAIDTSKSMLTPDVKPDRLTRAKLAIADFVNKLDGDGVGLIAFAGTAFLQCPVTLDYDAFNETLDAVDTSTIPRGGTNISRAIEETAAALQQRPSTAKILILLTDGEDLEGDAKVAAQEAAKNGMKIYTVGVGTVNGDLIPVDGGGFLKDDSGQFVRSHLDESGLKAIAEATGGIYAPLGAQGEGLGTIYQQAIAPLTKHELESRRQKVYIERFQWPLGLSLLFLLASLGVGTRRTLRKVMVPSTKKPQPILSTVGLLFMGLLLGAMSSAEASVSQAEQAYKKGDFETAAQEYASAAKEDPAKSELQYNLGAAAYKKGDFTSAIKAFQESLSGEQKGDSQRLATQQNTYYNLGNSFYRAGEKSGKGDPQQTIQAWEQSLKAYDAALQLRPEDTDAKYNRELVQKKLDELKKQQPPQQNKQDQNKQDQNKSDQNKQDQSADQNQSPNKGQPSPGQQANQPSANGQPQNKPGEQPKPGDQSTANNPPNNASGQDQTKPGNTGQDQANANKGDQGTPDQPKSQQPLPPTEVKPPNTAQANAGNSSKSDQEKAATEAARAAGELTPEEARNLLDSMKSEERRFPTGPVTRTNRLSDDDKPQKDW